MLETLVLFVLGTVAGYAVLCVAVGPVPWWVMLLPVFLVLRSNYRAWGARRDRDALVKHLSKRL